MVVQDLSSDMPQEPSEKFNLILALRACEYCLQTLFCPLNVGILNQNLVGVSSNQHIYIYIYIYIHIYIYTYIYIQ